MTTKRVAINELKGSILQKEVEKILGLHGEVNKDWSDNTKRSILHYFNRTGYVEIQEGSVEDNQ